MINNIIKKNLQAGFVPLLVIAVIAVLAIGGGVYAVKKNNEKKVEVEDNLDTQANANADANANANANLGINANAKGSLLSLFNIKENTQCTFRGTKDGVTSLGTMYISADGSMSGDFTTTKAGASTESHIVVKSGTAYVWTGSQGAKMSVSNLTGSANANAQTKNYVDLSSQVDYECKSWVPVSSKFNIPSSVTFVDIDAMLKGNIKLPGTN